MRLTGAKHEAFLASPIAFAPCQNSPWRSAGSRRGLAGNSNRCVLDLRHVVDRGMKVLAIDPGKRTGVALIESRDDAAPVLLQFEEVYGGLEGFQTWWDNSRPMYDVLVAEDFRHREGIHGVDHTPERILGYLAPFKPVLQDPSGRLKRVSDAALKRLGLYLPGQPLRNAREAVRHAVDYLKRRGHTPTLRVGWGPG